MTRTYNTAHLLLIEPANLAVCRTWSRQFAGDFPVDGATAWPLDSWSDAVWDGWLTLTTRIVRHAGGQVAATYYRPHVAAARALEAHPHWLQREAVLGVSQERRDLGEIVLGILRAGEPFDREITRLEAAAGRSTIPAMTFEVIY